MSQHNGVHWDEIELWEKPRNEVFNIIPPEAVGPEMSPFDSAFLCGLLKRYKPRKIFEVGVAGGGTSAIVLQAMHDICDNYELVSIDYSEKYYRDCNKNTGYMCADFEKAVPWRCNHRSVFGSVAATFAEKYIKEKEIDFLILDTTHNLPGELLDYITLLPYMKDDGIIVMHDIALGHYYPGNAAPCILFAASQGEKYLNHDAEKMYSYPNIGAIKVDNSSRDSIENVFLALLSTWDYYPEVRQIFEYGNAIMKFYSQSKMEFYNIALGLNRKSAKTSNNFIPFHIIPKDSRIIVYGAGFIGNKVVDQIKDIDYCEIVAWVDVNAKNLGNDIREPGILKEGIKYDYLLIAIKDEVMAREAIQQLSFIGVDKKKIVLYSD